MPLVGSSMTADNRAMPDPPAAEYSRVNLFSDPIYRYLRITKGGPGGVPGQASEQDLIDAAWLQRLRRIHQLQSAWWVFATAEHSRFQHALGAMHLAGDWTRHLYPTLASAHVGTPSMALVEETMRMAGLLHDVGHGPFGHFFDENYLDRWDIDHEDLGRAIVGGPLADLIGSLGASPTADFGSGERVDPRWVAYLISPADLAGFEAPTWLAALKPALVGPCSAGDAEHRELGRAWADIVARRLKWKLVYQGLSDARDIPAGALSVTRDGFARSIRECLPAPLRGIEFEVDVAAQESRAFNPMTETAGILFYDPLENSFQQSRVLDLFRRLPVQMSLFRIFARDDGHRKELVAAANQVLKPG